MPEVGDVYTATLTVEGADASTSASLTVTAPDGTTSSPTATSSEGGAVWSATVPLTAAGIWRLRWLVTGAGAGADSSVVAVAPAAPASRRAYATTTDLAEWLGTAPPDDAERMLARATRYLDNRLLLAAIYRVDDAGQPVDADVAAALRDACCAQVEWWAAHGDDGTGAGADYTSVTAGSISLTRATGQAGMPRDPRVSPEAVEILAAAGLIRNGVIRGC